MRILVVAIICLSLSEGLAQTTLTNEQRLQWFRDAKFGLFIHWGLYALPAGEWKGIVYPGASEWIMYRAQVPVKEYEPLAQQFNPTRFNAEEWARLARDAGMKYLVITSKHHDGFAMYHSAASKYNIVDATPFKRDPMKELADACKKYDLKFCFYYSQAQDWHEANGLGNDWDFGPDSMKTFSQYFVEKAIPQVREILTEYGPIGLIWFDTPRTMNAAQSKELANLVHQLQPACLVDGRIGNEMGDYKTKGDNRLPSGATEMDWETPATMNTSWGFKKSDDNWKSPKQLIRALVEVTAKGGNYLLNVGPTDEGIIPGPSVQRLKDVGAWLKVHGEAVYGTRMAPWTIPPEWGMITSAQGKLYLHVFDWPTDGKLELHGLKNRVSTASLLDDHTRLKFEQKLGEKPGEPSLLITVPATPPDSNVSVIALDIEGPPNVSPQIFQEKSGTVTLFGLLAQVHNAGMPGIRKDDTGIRDWTNGDNWLSWDFTIDRPGRFRIDLGSYAITSGSGRTRKTLFEGGHQLMLGVAGQGLSFKADSSRTERPSPYFTDVVSEAGEVTISAPGSYTLQLRAKQLVTFQGNGCVVRWIRLRPVQEEARR